jgi:hypothetical protein
MSTKPRAQARKLDADRLLRVLAGGGRIVAMAGVELFIDTPSRAKIRVAAATLAALVSRGLVRRNCDGTLTPEADGQARLARAAAPDASLRFRAQHGALERADVAVDDVATAVVADAAESPLGWLARRKDRSGQPLVAAHLVAAGERLRADFTRAQMMPRVTANWEAATSAGRRGGERVDPAGFADAALAARERVTRALDAVGDGLSGVLVDVCCFLKGLETVERDRNWPVRAGKVVLVLSLERLARHYGLAAEARGPDGRGSIRAWAAPREAADA